MGRTTDHGTRHALSLVASSPLMRRYMLAFAAFRMAEWATWIAVLVYAFDRGGATAAGVVAFAMLIPSALFAPFAATFGDHLPREKLAFFGLVSQGLAMVVTAAAMLSGSHDLLVYGAATVASALLTISRPAHFSLLPRMAESTAELTSANAASSIVSGAASILSPAVAAILLAIATPGAVWMTMGILVLLASLLIVPSRVGMIDQDFARISARDLLRSSLQGFRTIATELEPRLLAGLNGIETVIEGALDVLIVALAIDVFNRGDASVGVMNTALGVGALIGAVATTSLVGRRRLAPAIIAGGLVFGFGIALAGVAGAFALAVVAIAAAGSGKVFTETAGRTLIQRVVDDQVLTRIFGAIEGARMLGLALGALLVPILVAAFDERTATVIIGLLLPAVLLVRGRAILRLDTVAAVPKRSLELLRAIPMFAELDPSTIERVAAQLEEVEALANTPVIIQGEPGDLFYVIDSGRCAVSVDGNEIAVLGPGEFFGEIALLRDVPRTAQVTATEDSVLRTLERDHFLEAVTGLPRAAIIAHQTSEDRLDGIGQDDDRP